MALKIKIESAAGGMTLDAADLKTSLKTLRDKDGERVGEEVEWRVKAVLGGSDATEVAEKRQQLEHILAEEPVSVALLENNITVESLDSANVTDGPEFVGLSADGEDLTRHVSVAFVVKGILFEATGNILESDLTTEHIWDEEVYGRRVRGRVRVRDGADAYSAAMRYQPPLPAGGRWLRRRIAVLPGNLAEFEFHYTTAPSPLPRGVSFSRRIVAVNDEEGRRTVEYEAEFRGRGAEEAAERFRPQGNLIGCRIVKEDGAVKVRYRVVERGEKETVVVRRLVVRGGGRSVKAVGGQNRVAVFTGGVVPVEVEERGEAVRLNQPPGVVSPLKLKDLVLAERSYEVEPETLDVGGRVVAWRMRWRFVYLMKQAVADPSGLLSRLLNALPEG